MILQSGCSLISVRPSALQVPKCKLLLQGKALLPYDTSCKIVCFCSFSLCYVVYTLTCLSFFITPQKNTLPLSSPMFEQIAPKFEKQLIYLLLLFFHMVVDFRVPPWLDLCTGCRTMKEETTKRRHSSAKQTVLRPGGMHACEIYYTSLFSC